MLKQLHCKAKDRHFWFERGKKFQSSDLCGHKEATIITQPNGKVNCVTVSINQPRKSLLSGCSGCNFIGYYSSLPIFWCPFQAIWHTGLSQRTQFSVLSILGLSPSLEPSKPLVFWQLMGHWLHQRMQAANAKKIRLCSEAMPSSLLL